MILFYLYPCVCQPKCIAQLLLTIKSYSALLLQKLYIYYCIYLHITHVNKITEISCKKYSNHDLLPKKHVTCFTKKYSDLEMRIMQRSYRYNNEVIYQLYLFVSTH